MNKTSFAFGKTNFIMMAVAVLIIIVGFVLMGGDGSTTEQFNPDIFSTRRIVVAPIVCLVGFFGVGFAIMYRGKSNVPPTPPTNDDTL